MKKLRTKFYRWLAKSRLIRRYEYLREVNNLLEEFNTELILAGGPEELLLNFRKELTKLQNESKTSTRLIEFLRRTK